MGRYWMVSDRGVDRVGGKFLGGRGEMSYWVSEGGPLDQYGSWREVEVGAFRKGVLEVVAGFPGSVEPGRHGGQKHVTLFVHGYNNTWEEEARRYQGICANLFEGEEGMGVCIWFDWPSRGTAMGYLPDRGLAEACAPDLADVLGEFYEWLVGMQKSAANLGSVCRAKTSIIAHSMGNYLLQRGMYLLWRRLNQPLLVSLVNQLLMVAADVDNDLFKSGESVQNTDGDAIANLTYRVTALYSGLDAVLGASAGLKHFGKRRLGRSGIDETSVVADNVWEVDCTPLLPGGAGFAEEWRVHGIYFEEEKIVGLMREVLRGVDRDILVARGVVPKG